MNEPSSELDHLAHAVIGAAIEVHRHLGPGFLEAVYEEAMRIELADRGIIVESQVTIPIRYKGQVVGSSRIDLLVGGELVVELKAVESIDAVHFAQLRSYLKAGAFQLGLLVNFNAPLLRDGLRRVIAPG